MVLTPPDTPVAQKALFPKKGPLFKMKGHRAEITFSFSTNCILFCPFSGKKPFLRIKRREKRWNVSGQGMKSGSRTVSSDGHSGLSSHFCLRGLLLTLSAESVIGSI